MKLSTFRKGIHPKEFKELTETSSIEDIPPPDEVWIPLQQHIGVPCSPLVSRGDEVKTGQVIGRSEKFVSSPVHSSVTGKVKGVGEFLHPSGAQVLMIHIQRTGDDEWELLNRPSDWEKASVEELRNVVRDAGIVGLGGAAFPTHVKLSPPRDKKIDTFILNGCECEPYLTADHRAMLELSDKILTGMQIMMKILGTENGFIGIENNKPEAIKRMSDRVRSLNLPFEVVPLQTKYPQGAEKMLIDAILHRQVPAGGLPMDVGVVVNNVGTALAVADAVVEGKPLIRRIVTVTGDAVNKPANLMVRIGTPFNRIIEHCGGLKENTAKVIMGGPMMGIAQSVLDVPIVKATSGILCVTDERVPKEENYPCIRCASCVSVCPMFLMPTRLARMSELGFYEEADQLGILNCIECGSCAYICPSHIPLVQLIRIGKFKVTELRRKRA